MTNGHTAPEWAHDEQQERALVATVIDAIHARLRDDPAMHVYHYGHVEVSVLKRLCMLYAIREDELDQLLRRHVFVDLPRPSARPCASASRATASRRSRQLPGFVRTADVGRGADAVLEYERYLGSRDEQHLRAIESYNDEDCRSTVAVFDWLRDQAPGDVTWLAPADGQDAERGAVTSRASASCCASSSSRASPRAASAGSPASCSRTTAARRSSSGGPTSSARR